MDMRQSIFVFLMIVLTIVLIISIFLFLTSSSGRQPLWTQSTVFGFDNFGTATYEDGILYAPSKGNNKVYALDAAIGAMVWSADVRQCDASPCIDDDRVYVGECFSPDRTPTPQPKAIALNKTNGNQIWSFTEPENRAWVGSPVASGDFVYFTTFGSGVYALNRTNGNPIWNRADIGEVICSVAYHNGLIFVSAHNPPGQYALNATTGEDLWHIDIGASWDTSPVIYDGMIIQTVSNTTTGSTYNAREWSTYVLNETTGATIRVFQGKGSPSTPLVHGGKIFIPSKADRQMWAYDLETGEELWHTTSLRGDNAHAVSYCSPAGAGGTIYYQTYTGVFYAISEARGEILWTASLGGLGFGSPSIGNGSVFITNDASLYAFKIDYETGDWPMFCQNKLHQSHI